MDTDYHLFGIHATTIAYMNTNRPGNVKAPREFGPWLRSQIAGRGMTQGEFAKKIGVSPTSVSRWIKHGDRPKAEHLDPISDVLVLNYDVVATKAGYRPQDPEADPETRFSEALELIIRVNWETDPTRLDILRSVLQTWIDQDVKINDELRAERQ
jgi:transcriptional regulator with XRE-family HTH domain